MLNFTEVISPASGNCIVNFAEVISLPMATAYWTLLR